MNYQGLSNKHTPLADVHLRRRFKTSC